MATRFSLRLIIFSTLLWSVIFGFPSTVLADETSDAYVPLGMTIVDRYNANTPSPITDEERAWIQWGIEHEGIPARALHHKEKTWTHDSIQQSASVYEGVYTWERGIYDFARGDRERAVQTLGHLLHLVIDAHSLAQAVPDDIRGTVWRDAMRQSSTGDKEALIGDGVEMIERFFREASSAPALLQPATRTNFPLHFFRSIAVAIQDKMRGAFYVASDYIKTAFARTAPTTLGGVRVPELPAVVRAEEKVEEPEAIVRSRHIPPPLLPLAQSVAALNLDPLSPPLVVIEEEVLPPPSVVEVVPPPTPLEIPFVVPIDPPPTPIVVLAEPEKPPAVDYMGFPIGYIPRAGPAPTDTTPPDTTLIQSPPTLTNSASATFVFIASEDGATFGYALDGGAWQATVSPLIMSDLSDGEHTVTIRAIDSAGNSDPTPVSVTWTIDTVAPASPTLTSPTTEASYTTTASTVTLAGGRENGTVMTIDGATDGITAPTETSWEKIISLALGETIFSITATDSAGNVSAPTTLTITRTEDAPPPPPPPPDPPPPPPPPVAILRIKEVHFDGGAATEYVIIENSGTAEQLLQGWKLHDAATAPHTYTFGAFTLVAGATVAVHTGAGVDTSTDLYWNRGSGVWNDGGDTAFLKDGGGALIDSVSW